MRKTHKTQQGQAMVEFALIAIVLLALVFALMDLARAGFMQHDLNAGAGDLASHLAALSGTNYSDSGDPNYSGDPNSYIPTPLDPTDPYTTTFSTDPSLDPSLAITKTVSQAIQGYLDHAAQIANHHFSASPLTTMTTVTTTTPMQATTTMTSTNGQVTVVATSDLTNTSGLTDTTELTVTVTAPFTPVVGFFLNNAVLHLQARASLRTPEGL